jgi:hypothetical protein
VKNLSSQRAGVPSTLPMLVTLLFAQSALLVPPARNEMGRRSFVVAGVAAPFPFLLPPSAAEASAEAKQALLAKARAREVAEYQEPIDPLTLRLRQARKELVECADKIANKEWDDVRKVTNNLLPLMTFKGYTGESVKARAESWYDAGETERSKEILTRRGVLMRKLSTLENGVFAAQTSNKKKMVSAAELDLALRESVTALDALLEKMDCPNRWKSGACEILPLPENRDFMRTRAF